MYKRPGPRRQSTLRCPRNRRLESVEAGRFPIRWRFPWRRHPGLTGHQRKLCMLQLIRNAGEGGGYSCQGTRTKIMSGGGRLSTLTQRQIQEKQTERKRESAPVRGRQAPHMLCMAQSHPMYSQLVKFPGKWRIFRGNRAWPVLFMKAGKVQNPAMYQEDPAIFANNTRQTRLRGISAINRAATFF